MKIPRRVNNERSLLDRIAVKDSLIISKNSMDQKRDQEMRQYCFIRNGGIQSDLNSKLSMPDKRRK